MAQMLADQLNSPDEMEGDGIGADLIRVIRRIARAEERLREIDRKFVLLEECELFELKSKVEEAEREKRDLLAEMAVRIKDQIAVAHGRLDDETKLRNE